METQSTQSLVMIEYFPYQNLPFLKAGFIWVLIFVSVNRKIKIKFPRRNIPSNISKFDLSQKNLEHVQKIVQGSHNQLFTIKAFFKTTFNYHFSRIFLETLFGSEWVDYHPFNHITKGLTLTQISWEHSLLNLVKVGVLFPCWYPTFTKNTYQFF